MNITFDKGADALYIQVTTQEIANTVPINDRVLVDMDAAGNTVGVEVLDASSQKELIRELESHVLHGVPVSISASITST